MGLSNDLIKQFVKITNDETKPVNETTVMGTVSNVDGEMCVKIDGSEIPIPATTAVDINEGNRVIVSIKNHNAIITSNISAISAGKEKVDEFNKTYSDAITGLIGPDSNPYAIENTGNGLQFKDGSAVPAQIKDQTLLMEQAEIKGELKIGKFIWVKHGNGNMGLMWEDDD